MNPVVYRYVSAENGIGIHTKNLLFEEHAKIGDYKSRKLKDGLVVHVPLALYGTKERTFPVSNREMLSNLKTQMSQAVASDQTAMWADVAVTWNVIKYFHPYLADLELNWDNELVKALLKLDTETLRSAVIRKPSGWLNDNVLYLNLLASDFEVIKTLLAERKPQQTVIMDIRNGSRFLFRFAVDLLSPNSNYRMRNGIYNIPTIAFPETPVIKDTLSYKQLNTPNMKNLFLIGPLNMSNHEDELDFVRFAGIGYFIGANTGGCNGAINQIHLPSGREVIFTGTKVLSNLGAGNYYYRTGIAPDVYVEESIEDIKTGHDTVLEKAYAIATKRPY